MPGHDIIVVGASAGGVELLCQLVSNLPQDLPAAIFIVLHVPVHGTSVLPSILNRAIARKHKTATTHLQALHPKDGEKIEYGKIYIAPSDRHLLIKGGCVHLAMGPKENSHRPAIDPLFRTAARTYGERVIGVVLSGLLDDGTAGLAAIKQRGGMAVAQDPDEAMYSGMPRSAIDNVDVDRVLPVAGIVTFLSEIVSAPVSEEKTEFVPEQMQIETEIIEMDIAAIENNQRPGKPSGYACPECRGVLWEIHEGKLTRFRCRTGHAFSVNSLIAEQSDALEIALWSALRALEEKAALTQRMTEQAIARNQPFSAKRFREQAQDSFQRATLVRDLLLQEQDKDSSFKNDESFAKNLDNSLTSDLQGNNQHSNGKTATKNVVAIGVPADGMSHLTELLAALDADFPAAIVVAQRCTSQQQQQLIERLIHATSLKVKQAQAGDILLPGTIYLAPPDRHLIVNLDGNIALFQSKLVDFASPATDLLFESIANNFQSRAIAIMLAFADDEGTVGMQAIKEMGGVAIAVTAQNGADVKIDKEAIADNINFISMPLEAIAPSLLDLLKNQQAVINNIT